ncbi:MAG TPA: acyl-homoserine-lactone synthase [Trinickia sp.]|uniref:acyl-homoserine-lactone synthase n=1 Tax=Trinickia sp. TaxID=2571163 RepID=UPI002C121185|nr:acyl-homoserine-lactone synthase [Trinickia sp.]HTI16709.1 acyl-homoserine-lactone synthase [Trinickia sp.]
MQPKITIGSQRDFDVEALAEMYRLRAKVFGERMGWEVAILSGMEIDGYDALTPHYMLVHDEDDSLCGCWRLMPTTGPYMLRDTFAQLLHGQRAPVAPDVWELSRFAMVSPDKCGFGFAELALDTMREAVKFADRMVIKNYVTVTTIAIERMLKKAGIQTRRFGPPMRIGVENAIALTIELGEQTRRALSVQLVEAV